jgi:CubicO group peptidase (beta-lactamase class C family)
VYYDVVGHRGADDPRPLTKDALFRIYSMSKSITAVAAMQLYEQGKFQLCDPVSKFVPELDEVMVLNGDGELEPPATTMTMQQARWASTTGVGRQERSSGSIPWKTLSWSP